MARTPSLRQALSVSSIGPPMRKKSVSMPCDVSDRARSSDPVSDPMRASLGRARPLPASAERAAALEDRVVPDRHEVVIRGRQMGNLEGTAPQSGDTTGNPLDAPADHGAGWIEREREEPYGLDRLSELARDVTANAAGIVRPGFHRPVERELTFPPGHQGGGRRRGRQAAAGSLAGGGQSDQSEPDPGDGEADLARHTLSLPDRAYHCHLHSRRPPTVA